MKAITHRAVCRTRADDVAIRGVVSFWCPGCEGRETVPVVADGYEPLWGYNGDGDAPTITPSILVRWGRDGARVCHSFVTAGRIQFLDDCTHALAGLTVDLPDLPEHVVDGIERARPDLDE